ncbi:MAG: patatin-like phospholipase family protein [Azospirillaceae bacterium]|nr:patatin-like phospholipase family protein [Azospirillaceae bacterium]
MVTAVYGIFEGGGAKGIAHIAGVKAAERSDLEFIGVAGASAGALIAALIAVGYKADQIFDPESPSTNLLNRHSISPLSLLGGPEKWAMFETSQRKAATVAKWAMRGGMAAAWLKSPGTVKVAREIASTGGFFDTEPVRHALNEFLHTKLRMHHANAGRDIVVPERVRFRDIDPTVAPECCSLKVIVTDVTNRRMIVFGDMRQHGDVEVAEAVAASIAIPGVFKPARIPSYRHGPDALYADGGLVSNLPIWVFAEEKLNYERSALPCGKVPTLAFSLRDDEEDTVAPLNQNSFAYWVSTIRTAVFGGQTVARLFAADLQPVQMAIRLRVTEFGFSTKRALEGYQDAYTDAARSVVRNVRLFPANRTALLKAFHDNAIGLIRNNPKLNGISKIRIALVRPIPGTNSFRVEASYNMDQDPDDRLIFSRLSEGAPVAFHGRAPTLLDLPTFSASSIPPNMTKYEYALVRGNLVTAICLPIFADGVAWEDPVPDNRPPPLGVVSIDSVQPLDQLFAEVDAIKKLATYSLTLAPALEP